MTEPEHQILQSLRSGPKSLTELWQRLGAPWTAEQIDNALASLQDARKVVLLVAVGLYALGVDA